MTFELSPEHEQFRRSVRDFAEAEIAPHAAQWDRDHHFPTDVVQKMGALGLMGLTAPEEFGGAGMAGEDGGFTSLCLAIEEIGRVDQSMGITLEAAVGLGINPILTYGTDEQKKAWLPELVSGDKIAGFGLTEPGAGSDAGATKTKAVLDDGEWVVNGSKQFITNSGSDITSLVTVTARTGVRRSRRSSSRPTRLASSRRRRTTSSAGTPPTPTRCRSATRGCRSRTCSASGAAATPSSSRRWTTVASRSPRSRSGASRRASTCRCSTPASGRPSAARSDASRVSPSRSRTCR